MPKIGLKCLSPTIATLPREKGHWFSIGSVHFGFHAGDVIIDRWNDVYNTLSGWWLTYPSEKYESQLGLLFPISGKIKTFQTANQHFNCTDTKPNIVPAFFVKSKIHQILNHQLTPKLCDLIDVEHLMSSLPTRSEQPSKVPRKLFPRQADYHSDQSSCSNLPLELSKICIFWWCTPFSR